jgi:tape measure domain-containing protein
MGDQADFTVKVTGKNPGMDKVEKSIGRVLGANRKFARGTEQATKATGRFVQESGRLGNAGGALSVLGGNLMTSAVSKAVDLGRAVASTAAELVAFGQNARFAFGNLTKHGADPEKLFEHARALAVRFGLDVQDTTKQYQKFLALQFTPKGIDKLIKMGADLQALGNSAEDVQGVFLALGQIKGKGRFQGEEMLQLAERGVSTTLVQEEIGKILGGKTQQEVQKLMQAGKVSSDVGLQAIEQAINRKLGQKTVGQAGAKFADTTLTGMLGRITALGQDTGVSLLDQVTAPLTKMTGRGLDALQGFLSSPEGAATIDRLAASLGRAAEFVVTLGGAFTDAFGATFESNVRPMLEAFGVFGEGESTAKALGKTFGDLAAFTVAAATGLGLVGTAAAYIIEPIYVLGKALLEGIINPLAKIAADIYLWVERVSGIFTDSSMMLGEKAWEIGKAIVTGVANGIWSLVTLPADTLKSMGVQALGALSDIFQIHSPSRATRRMGVQVGRGLALGVGHEEGHVQSSSQSMASASLGGMESAFGPAFGPAMSGLGASSTDGGAARAPAQFTFSVSQQIDGGGSPEETARLAAREARREFEAFFRQVALEV